MNKLKIATWNIDGLTPKKNEDENLLKIYNLDALLISEPHLTSNSQIHVHNYNVYSTNHPDGTAHGGTAIIIRTSIEHYELPQFRSESIQATSISRMKMGISVSPRFIVLQSTL
ncbi:unnamed protein product [Pieris macdunnoughi]|uniref:Endonuclease/exonuclease/phosphatase domain-containing protein n=1 Tax=Pieris macdunnoughi TaxID=345717 RepID=A0A821US14_9NEOP|nr:unnamed protein product [Pieris macdunnoughi]